jgi:Protein of unknown function (DUF2637)
VLRTARSTTVGARRVLAHESATRRADHGLSPNDRPNVRATVTLKAWPLETTEGRQVDIASRVKPVINRAFGDLLWIVILVPILSISWVGFYTIARDVGIPPIFAAGLSAAFDGIALFAARIGLKHRRKGFSGYLARITVVLFAALGAFVQSYHAESKPWIHAHSWIVWSIAPVAAALAYELHLGWAHRKQLIRAGYEHPSAKTGFGPVTWIMFPRETLSEYRAVLRARRAYIAKSNLKRFKLEEAAQPQMSTPEPRPMPREPRLPAPPPAPTPPAVPTPRVPRQKSTRPSTHPVPTRPAALHSVPNSRPKSTRKAASSNDEVKRWCTEHGYELGFNGRVPIAGLRAYRAAQKLAS